MIYLIFFAVCFGSSIVGAICGIGGGVIIKPVLDAFGVLDVSAISFLSGCTVLSMTTYSVVKNKVSKESHISVGIGLPLAVGAAAGGLLGKWLFSYIRALSANPNRVGAAQAACLTVVTIGTLLYTLSKDKIKTFQMENAIVCVGIGVILGVLSSFLGIGGGPINLVVLFFFFSMNTKTAAEYSLYIIFFSQATSLVSSAATRSIPDFGLGVLVLMVAGGILGGIFGRSLNKKMNEKMVDKLFIALMGLMIAINIYNVYKFS